jgi:hypothetical protein
MQLTKPELAAVTARAAKLQVNLDPAELKLSIGLAKPAGVSASTFSLNKSKQWN